MLVHYADKLCINAHIVTLDERLADLAVRYPQYRELFDQYTPIEREIEAKIFNLIDLDPQDLPTLLNNKAADTLTSSHNCAIMDQE